MGSPVPLQADFSLGMRRDESRDRLPDGASWLLADFIPGHGAPLRKRGGWRYHGDALPVEEGEPPASVEALIFAEFAADPRLVAVDDLGNLHAGPVVSDSTVQEPPGSDWTESGDYAGVWKGLSDERQRVLAQFPGGWTLTFDGETTVSMPHTTTAAAVRAALEDLSTIGANNVTVAPVGGNPDLYYVTFVGVFAGTDVPEMSSVGGTVATVEQGGVGPSYTTGQVVADAGRGWQALRPSSGVAPVEGDDWTELAPWRGPWSAQPDGYDLGDYTHKSGTVYVADFVPQELTSLEAVVTRSPVFFADLVILPLADGSDVPATYDGDTTIGSLDDAPEAIYGCVHRGRLVLANTPANPNRVFLSDPSDPAGWTTGNFIDCSAPGTGVASLYDRLLVWSDRRLEAITGAVPPAEEGSDMTLRPMFDVGCANNRSIVVTGDKAIFANAEGIYMTDGVSLNDLTEIGGMKLRWADLIDSWDGQILPGGIYRNHYLVRVGSALVVCDLAKAAFWEFANVAATMFAHSTRVREELYFGLETEARVARFSPAFTGTNSTDADGPAILPVLETPYYIAGSLGIKSWKGPRLTYMLDSDAATLELGYVTEPHDTGYTAIGSLDPSGYARREINGGLGRTLGVAFRLSQQGPSEDTHIHAIEAEVSRAEGSRSS